MFLLRHILLQLCTTLLVPLCTNDSLYIVLDNLAIGVAGWVSAMPTVKLTQETVPDVDDNGAGLGTEPGLSALGAVNNSPRVQGLLDTLRCRGDALFERHGKTDLLCHDRTRHANSGSLENPVIPVDCVFDLGRGNLASGNSAHMLRTFSPPRMIISLMRSLM
jgi:hypothetical protein